MICIRPNSIPNLCRDIRASILLAGPDVGAAQVGRTAAARRRHHRPPPRRYALSGFQPVGRGDADRRRIPRRGTELVGADILLDEASVTGTENAIMAAVLAHGTTIFRNAASEPHVQELCQLLNSMGARIERHRLQHADD